MCRAGDDGPDFFSDRRLKARKMHRCDECKRAIMAGETYNNYFSVHEGASYTHKMCAHCEIGAAWLVKNCGGYVFGEIRDDLYEHAEEYPGIAPQILVLTNGMRHQWSSARITGCVPGSTDRFVPIPPLPPIVNVENHT